jgi:hypothetical protein
MATQTTQMTQAQMAQLSAQAQTLTLGSQLFNKIIQNISSPALGSIQRNQINNVGIVTDLDIEVNLTLTNTSSSNVISGPNSHAPFSLFSNVQFKDYSQYNRIDCSGYQLYLNNFQRYGYKYGSAYSGALIPNFDVLPASLAVSSSADVSFVIRVPLAYNPRSDLRGAILAQRNTGEAFLNFTLNNLSALQSGNDAFYSTNGADLTVAVNSINIYQNYYLPYVANGQYLLPSQQLGVVYEVNGQLTTTSNISGGVEKLIDYQTQRQILSQTIQFYNTSTGSNVANPITSDFSKVRLIANTSQTLNEWTPNRLVAAYRNMFHDDLPLDVIYIPSLPPVNTELYGQVQLGLTPASGVTGGIMQVLTESMFNTGSPLSGLVQ